MPCTTILVGKNVSFDGSTLVARNEDSGAGGYMPKKMVVVHPHMQPRQYKSVISHVEITLPENPMKYTAFPNAIDGEGVWAACGVNEKNVAMNATETITSNDRVLSADPLVVYKPATSSSAEQWGGIGEEDMVSIVLPYISSAKEGVERLGKLLETYGTYEMNGIAFQDCNDIWWMETIGGHHWIARRVPDDAYVVVANQFSIDEFDFDDAFGEQKSYMCSADLREFIDEHHLSLDLTSSFNPRLAFGSHSDADHVYNTPRIWMAQQLLNPSTKWFGENSEYSPHSDNLPWCRKPERKITIEDIKYLLSHHYQGTDYDAYGKHGDPLKKASFRPIGVNRTNFLGLVQLRNNKPEHIQAIEWVALGSNVFNAIVPFYTNVNSIPNYLSETNGTVSTESFYWANRIIAALSDPHFALCSSHIERYQNAVLTKGLEIIKNYDKKLVDITSDSEDVVKLCQQANEEIASMVKAKTDELLAKVLYEASNQMKNGFSRSDA